MQNLLGWIHYVLGDYPTAEALYTIARKLAEAAGERGRRLLVQLDANFGQYYAASGSYDEALRLLSNSIVSKQVRTKSGPNHVAQGSACALSCRATIHGDRGGFALADRDLKLARELCHTGHAVEGSVFALNAMVELQRREWEACRSAALRSHSIAEPTVTTPSRPAPPTKPTRASCSHATATHYVSCATALSRSRAAAQSSFSRSHRAASRTLLGSPLISHSPSTGPNARSSEHASTTHSAKPPQSCNTSAYAPTRSKPSHRPASHLQPAPTSTSQSHLSDSLRSALRNDLSVRIDAKHFDVLVVGHSQLHGYALRK